MRKSRPKTNQKQRNEIEQAVRMFLQAIGASTLSQVGQTPRRVASLWQQILLAGQHQDLHALLSRSLLPVQFQTPIVFGPLPIHMVCPHHLTIGWGQAWLGYHPQQQIVGLGKLGELIQAATARLILQEEATSMIVQTIHEALAAKASWARLVMHHPCHWLHEPGAQQALLCTEASLGSPTLVRKLSAMAQPAPFTPMLPHKKPSRTRLRK